MHFHRLRAHHGSTPTSMATRAHVSNTVAPTNVAKPANGANGALHSAHNTAANVWNGAGNSQTAGAAGAARRLSSRRPSHKTQADWTCRKCNSEHAAHHTRCYPCNLEKGMAMNWRTKANDGNNNQAGKRFARNRSRPRSRPLIDQVSTAPAGGETLRIQVDEDGAPMETDPELEDLKSKHDMVVAQLESIKLFQTPHAEEQRQAYRGEIIQIRHTITMRKPPQQRLHTFTKALATRNTQLEVAYEKMLAAERAIDVAMAASAEASEEYKAKLASVEEMQQLFAQAQQDVAAAEPFPTSPVAPDHTCTEALHLLDHHIKQGTPITPSLQQQLQSLLASLPVEAPSAPKKPPAAVATEAPYEGVDLTISTPPSPRQAATLSSEVTVVETPTAPSVAIIDIEALSKANEERQEKVKATQEAARAHINSAHSVESPTSRALSPPKVDDGPSAKRRVLGCTAELPPVNQEAIEALKAIAVAINSAYPQECLQIGMAMLNLPLAQIQSYAADQQALVDMCKVIANTITTPDSEQPAGLFRELNWHPTPH